MVQAQAQALETAPHATWRSTIRLGRGPRGRPALLLLLHVRAGRRGERRGEGREGQAEMELTSWANKLQRVEGYRSRVIIWLGWSPRPPTNCCTVVVAAAAAGLGGLGELSFGRARAPVCRFGRGQRKKEERGESRSLVAKWLSVEWWSLWGVTRSSTLSGRIDSALLARLSAWARLGHLHDG